MGKLERELASGLESSDGRTSIQDLVRIAVDGTAKYVALCAHRSDRLAVIDTTSSRASAVQLKSESVTDFRWLDTPAGVRLAAITQSGKTLLIDPSRFEQHSGQSNQTTLAILPRVAEEALTSGYVIMSNGHIEPLIVQDQGGAKAARPQSTCCRYGLCKDKSTQVDPAGTVLKQLQFTPAKGPWIQWRDQAYIDVGAGLAASDEPAIFVLNEKLQQQWHAPLAIQDGAEICGASVAMDPGSNQPLWVVATAASTLHFFALMASLSMIVDCLERSAGWR